MKRLLITGACGNVATAILDNLAKKYELVLCDKHIRTNRYPVHQIDLVDYSAIQQLCKNINCVIHLAADPSLTAEWDSLLPNNIIATQNVFQAASISGCQRVIFASSLYTMMGHNKLLPIKTDMTTFPTNLYGTSKVFGEALARYYSYKKKLSVICLRLGWVLPASSEHLNLNNKDLSKVLTYADLNQLIEAAINTNHHFGIFHGLSNNRKCYFDMHNSRKYLGYKPKDDAFKIAGKKHGIVKRFISWARN